MNKYIKYLVESFFDDVEDDITTDNLDTLSDLYDNMVDCKTLEELKDNAIIQSHIEDLIKIYYNQEERNLLTATLQYIKTVKNKNYTYDFEKEISYHDRYALYLIPKSKLNYKICIQIDTFHSSITLSVIKNNGTILKGKTYINSVDTYNITMHYLNQSLDNYISEYNPYIHLNESFFDDIENDIDSDYTDKLDHCYIKDMKKCETVLDVVNSIYDQMYINNLISIILEYRNYIPVHNVNKLKDIFNKYINIVSKNDNYTINYTIPEYYHTPSNQYGKPTINCISKDKSLNYTIYFLFDMDNKNVLKITMYVYDGNIILNSTDIEITKDSDESKVLNNFRNTLEDRIEFAVKTMGYKLNESFFDSIEDDITEYTVDDGIASIHNKKLLEEIKLPEYITDYTQYPNILDNDSADKYIFYKQFIYDYLTKFAYKHNPDNNYSVAITLSDNNIEYDYITFVITNDHSSGSIYRFWFMNGYITATASLDIGIITGYTFILYMNKFIELLKFLYNQYKLYINNIMINENGSWIQYFNINDNINDIDKNMLPNFYLYNTDNNIIPKNISFTDKFNLNKITIEVENLNDDTISLNTFENILDIIKLKYNTNNLLLDHVSQTMYKQLYCRFLTWSSKNDNICVFNKDGIGEYVYNYVIHKYTDIFDYNTYDIKFVDLSRTVKRTKKNNKHIHINLKLYYIDDSNIKHIYTFKCIVQLTAKITDEILTKENNE